MISYYGSRNIANIIRTMREYNELLVFMAGSEPSAIMFGWQSEEYVIRQFDTDAFHGPNPAAALFFFSNLVIGKNMSPWLTDRMTELLWAGTKLFLSKKNGHIYQLSFEADQFKVSWGLEHFHNEKFFSEYADAAAFFDERVCE